MANKNISVSDLDFDSIKQNLKEYLKGQSQFSDYNFEGSGLSVLIDLLAFNTHYNSLYTNLAVNESFLDSASKRDSVVSIANGLGYLPRSAKCSSALLDLVVTGSQIPANSLLVLPNRTPFTTNIDGKTYTFYTRSSYTSSTSEPYTFTDIEITEGVPLSFKFTVAEGSRYILPNINVDLDTLQVTVQENSNTSDFETFLSSKSIINVTSLSSIYFIKEIEGGLYELVFGDGVIGKALEVGNIINVDYFVSNLSAPNEARVFTYGGPSLFGGTVSVITKSAASGGDEPESIESIKFNAPRSFAAQNRAVTANDYKALIYSLLPQAKSVIVWGGEDNTPPVYGKTFISVKPEESSRLTTLQKTNLINQILEQRGIVSIVPEIVDPDYVDLELNVAVYYNDKATTMTASDVKTKVTEVIAKYNDTDLQQFDGIFRHSKVMRLIDTSDPSFTGCVVNPKIYRKLFPRFNLRAQYFVNLVNPIYTDGEAGTGVNSSGFFIPGSSNIHYIDDDGAGQLRLFFFTSEGLRNVVNANIGSVDYLKGQINISSLEIVALEFNTDFELIVSPKSYDIVSVQTQIVQIDMKRLNVNVIADRIATGDSRAGNNFTFTPTR